MLDINKLYQELKSKISEEQILLNANMKDYTSFKIGGKADILVTAKNIEEVRLILSISKKENCPLFVLGNGTNILVKDSGIRGIVLRNRIDYIKVLNKKDEKNIEIEVGAGVKNTMLAQKLLKLDLSGFEFASRNTRYHRWSN